MARAYMGVCAVRGGPCGLGPRCTFLTPCGGNCPPRLEAETSGGRTKNSAYKKGGDQVPAFGLLAQVEDR